MLVLAGGVVGPSVLAAVAVAELVHALSSLPLVPRRQNPGIADGTTLREEAFEESLRRLRSVSTLSVENRAELAGLLGKCTGATDDHVIVAALDVVRTHAGDAVDLAETLSQLLPHQAAIYQGRDKWQVLRLRAYLFVTLSEIGITRSVLPMLIDALAFVDERMSAVEFGAAVRAVSTLGPEGRGFAPYLLRTLGERFAEEEFSLDRYDYSFPPEEATTVQIEVMRALGAIGHYDDAEALEVLRTIAAGRNVAALDSRMVAASAEALRRIEARRGRADETQTKPLVIPLLTPWIGPSHRERLKNLDISLTDHDGRNAVLRNLVDRPVLLTFFYSRCQNRGKCSTTVSRLARLQHDLAERGIGDEVRLLAVTLEPQFDTPLRLKRYATDRGLELGARASALRLDPDHLGRLIKELDTPVGYSSGWVNSHGLQAVLLDGKGRPARTYVNLGWDNTVVVNDFQRTLAGR